MSGPSWLRRLRSAAFVLWRPRLSKPSPPGPLLFLGVGCSSAGGVVLQRHLWGGEGVRAETQTDAEAEAQTLRFSRSALLGGTAQKLHEGTVIYLSTGDPSDGELAVVRGYDAGTARWEVELQREPGTRKFLKDEEICYGYCLRAGNVNRTLSKFTLEIVNTAGKARGLVTTEPIKKGNVIFIDFPCIITASGDSDRKYDMRWRAYLAMHMKANADDEHALLADVFDQLAIDAPAEQSRALGDIVRAGWERRKAKASEIVRAAMGARSGGEQLSEKAMELEARRIADVFARFETNQFKFNTSLPPVRAAIYAYTSLLNHDCDPNVKIWPLEDALCARACKDLRPGDELTISYGPINASTSLEDRRNLLLEKHGFVCLCQRCKADSAAEVSRVGASRRWRFFVGRS